MRPEHQSNTQPRLLRKTALGDTTSAIAKRRGKVGKVKTARSAGVPAAGPATTKPAPDPGDRTGKARQTEAASPPSRKGQEPRQGAGEQRRSETRADRHSSRFMGPAQLDETLKAAIAAALEANDIGDEVGRQIFIGALEYQLGAFGSRLPRRDEPPSEGPPRSRADDALMAVGERARVLADGLSNLSETSQCSLAQALTSHDRLGRGYDEAYLRLLACEIDRVAQACRIAAKETAMPETPAEDPGPSRDLVAKLASVYTDCFEEDPKAEAGGRFAVLLAVLSEETGLVIGHDPDFLADIIGPEAR